jgi:catechol 2,3-dioxygenase-like lactoylglutathione lyase family enzyme
MKVDRILETSLYAGDLAAAEEFYTRVLGLEVHGRVEDRHVFFRCGAGMFLVFNPSTTEKETDLPHGCRGRGHAAWAVAAGELDAWRRHLERHGIRVHEHEWPQGGRSLYFSDPAGNSLEITTPGIWGISP